MDEQGVEIISSKRKGRQIIYALILDWRYRFTFFFYAWTYLGFLTSFLFSLATSVLCFKQCIPLSTPFVSPRNILTLCTPCFHMSWSWQWSSIGTQRSCGVLQASVSQAAWPCLAGRHPGGWRSTVEVKCRSYIYSSASHCCSTGLWLWIALGLLSYPGLMYAVIMLLIKSQFLMVSHNHGMTEVGWDIWELFCTPRARTISRHLLSSSKIPDISRQPVPVLTLKKSLSWCSEAAPCVSACACCLCLKLSP